jgi:hypothetical protein
MAGLTSTVAFEDRRNSEKHIVIVGPNSGGVGKTTGTKMVSSLALAAGLRVRIIEADPGLGSISKTLRPDRYEVLPFPKEQSADYASVVEEDAQGYDWVVIDFGANAMTRGSVSFTMRQALEDLRSSGWRTSAVLMLTAAKDGLPEDAENFAFQFRPFADVFLAYRGRERGGDFKKLDTMLGKNYPGIEFPDTEPGILADISARGLLPIDYARRQPEGFTKASAIIADHLYRVGIQESARKLLGRDFPTGELEALRIHRPARYYLSRPARWMVCDEVLTADQNYLVAESALCDLDEQSTDAQLRQAHADWKFMRQHRAKAHIAAEAAYA